MLICSWAWILGGQIDAHSHLEVVHTTNDVHQSRRRTPDAAASINRGGEGCNSSVSYRIPHHKHIQRRWLQRWRTYINIINSLTTLFYKLFVNLFIIIIIIYYKWLKWYNNDSFVNIRLSLTNHRSKDLDQWVENLRRISKFYKSEKR